MSKAVHNLKKALKNQNIKKADAYPIYSGVLGATIGGEKVVEVPGRDGYVYVRLRDSQNELIMVYNDKVSPVYGLPVVIQRDNIDSTRYRIVERDLARYTQWGSTAYTPKHGAQHSYNPDTPGGDISWIYSKQFMPLSLSPSGSSGAANVIINPYVFYNQNQWIYAGGTGTATLLGYKPTDNTAKMVLISLDSSGNPVDTEGTVTFDADITGVADVIPYIPSLPDTGNIPLGAVRLVSGTSVILWDNLYDLRPLIVGDGFIPTGTTGHIIRDNGVDQPNRSALNFIGQGIWINDDAGNNETEVIISGGSSGHEIRDSGVTVAQRSALNFIGAGVVLNDDAAEDETEIYISGTTFATLAESKAGVRSDAAVPPSGLPFWVRNNAIVAANNYGGNARGNYAVDLQHSRLSSDQVASGNFAVIGGGLNNKAAGVYSVIAGGYGNEVGISTYYGSILGGYGNRVGASYATAIGGIFNKASGTSSIAVGGQDNIASGLYSTVIGGLLNIAGGDYSVVLGGTRVEARLHGEFARSAGRFTSHGDAQESWFLLRNSTTDATATELFLDGSSARLTLPWDCTWVFNIYVAARRTDATDESAGYKFEGVIDNNSNTTALVGSVSKTVLAEDTVAWDVNVTADNTNKALVITVTGEAAKTIRWLASVHITQVKPS